MFELRTITLLICATAVLTSKPAPTQTENSSKGISVDAVERFDNQTEIRTTLKTISSSTKNITNNNTLVTTATTAHGPIEEIKPTKSSIVLSTIATSATVVAEGIEITPDDFVTPDSETKLLKSRKGSVVARKGAIPVSKITPRKGVVIETSTQSSDEDVDEVNFSSSTIPNPSGNDRSTAKIDEKIGKKIIVAEKNSSFARIDDSAGNEGSKSGLTINLTIPANSDDAGASSKTIVKIVVESSSTSAPTTTKRFKPKPTVTIGEMDIDKPIPASPTKTPPLGMPRKIDYIVPVIVTIIALPLLGGAAFLLWRRGRDCWDKRHYRRMDFLIDGMYNDHSWK